MGQENDGKRHTPGPWSYDGQNFAGDQIVNAAAQGRRIAEVSCRYPLEDRSLERVYEAQATARLIAAAPELLIHLKEAQAEITRLQGGFAGKTQERIAAVIAKAEGRENE